MFAGLLCHLGTYSGSQSGLGKHKMNMYLVNKKEQKLTGGTDNGSGKKGRITMK